MAGRLCDLHPELGGPRNTAQKGDATVLVSFAAAANNLLLGGLKPYKLIIFQFWSQKSQTSLTELKIKVSAGLWSLWKL